MSIGPSASRVVYTRLSPSELADLDRIARNLDISRAALMSLALRQVAGFVAAEPDLVDALNDLSVQIRAVGGNINQIARLDLHWFCSGRLPC
ncbi:hypothetical protein [Paracoccus sp. (in: a-proteobacteria)]|uniref:hypothetical protein n=1 Tax=Paracoccus sp. TaxID=267 RepID=UPI0028AC23F4|nr:hypothetical protein [Paracoccus sp. (in: a-proteobacteria)]